MKKNACKNAYLGSIFTHENTWLGCFLYVHGRAWYPLLPFECPPPPGALGRHSDIITRSKGFKWVRRYCTCNSPAKCYVRSGRPLPGLPDHALPVLNHDRTDHNTKPMEHWCTVYFTQSLLQKKHHFWMLWNCWGSNVGPSEQFSHSVIYMYVFLTKCSIKKTDEMAQYFSKITKSQ